MNWVAQLFLRHRSYADLSAEIRQHLEEKIDEMIASGLPRAEATRRAHREFGNPILLEERSREVWQWPRLESFLADVRFALRMLRKSPGFTTVAVLTLALGVGASAAVFSVVNAVLLKPLPFPHADKIVFLWRYPRLGLNTGFDIYPWGRADFSFFSQQSKTFEALGAIQGDSFNLTESGEPVRLNGVRVSAGFFPSLGVSPALGRTFTDEEDSPGREREVILSDALWRQRFGADSGILGRALELNGTPYTVIGVMPRDFAFPRGNEMPNIFNFAPQVQLWVPLALDRSLIPSGPDELAVIGRLKSGATVAQAQADMDRMGKYIESHRTNGKGWFRSNVVPLPSQAAGDTRKPLLLILGAVCVVLLIACSNVASLLLTRSLGRRRELTVRAALGAANSRLTCQLLTESTVLAGFGGVAGIVLAQAGIYFTRNFAPPSIPRLGEVTLDVRVFAFAFGVTLLTGILFGLVPAIFIAREPLVESLKEGGHRSGSSVATQKTRQALVVSQIALAVTLVIAAGLLTRSFYRALSVDPGFRPARVLTFQLTLPASKFPDQPRVMPVYHEVLDRLQALPGIQSAGLTETVPLDGATESTAIRINSSPASPELDIPMVNYTVVSQGYFAAVGTPILRGRSFLESDAANAMPVAVISSAMAKKFWPGEDPVGRQMAMPAVTIVGVVADVKHLTLRDAPSPEMYVPYTQKVWPSLLTMNIVLRTAQDPASMADSARQTIHSIDPDLPVSNVKTLEDVVSAATTQPRFAVFLLAAFAMLALLLATIGIYGVISHSVAQRAQEIGVRMALGAQRSNVLQMVLRQGGRLALLGIVIGLAAAFSGTRLMNSFLYGVEPTDPVTFTAVSILFLGVTLAASYIPARHATHVEPMVALRCQ